MKAQHVWAAAATTAESDTMGKQKTGKGVKYLSCGRVVTTTRMGVLALIMLMCFAAPLYAAIINIPAGTDLEGEVAAASDGDVLVLEGNTAPVLSTININKAITIQGYEDSPCENLPTDRVIAGEPDTCYTEADTNLFSLGFEPPAADQAKWVYSPTRLLH